MGNLCDKTSLIWKNGTYMESYNESWIHSRMPYWIEANSTTRYQSSSSCWPRSVHLHLCSLPLGHERSLTQIKFNAEGDLLFSCSKDHVINVWFSHNGERLGTYDGNNGTVWTLDVDCASCFPFRYDSLSKHLLVYWWFQLHDMQSRANSWCLAPPITPYACGPRKLEKICSHGNFLPLWNVLHSTMMEHRSYASLNNGWVISVLSESSKSIGMEMALTVSHWFFLYHLSLIWRSMVLNN